MKKYNNFITEEYSETGVFAVKIDDNILYLKIKYNNDLIYLELDGDLYQELSIELPTTSELGVDEFYMNPDVNMKIIKVLIDENFIEEGDNESVAGDQKTKSYKLV
jgi:hypothetical protein